MSSSSASLMRRIDHRPLIFGTPKQKTITNVLLVSTEMQQYQQFIDSANDSTFAIAYSMSSSKAELLYLLRNNSQTIQRIGFVFHSSENNLKMFLGMKPLFLKNEQAYAYSDNLQLLLDIISEFKVKNVDFLACNSLNYDLWRNYYSLLTEKTGVIVGASNNPTGNLQYGGDWIMESTGEDIESVYFTESIKNYQYLLAPGASFADNSIIYVIINDSSPPFTASAAGYVKPIVSVITIPSTASDGTNTYNVINIGDYAFSGDSGTVLASVTIPSSVTSIGNYAFIYATTLSSVTFDGTSSLASIGNQAFFENNSLTSIALPPSVASIGDQAFSNCTNLTSFTIPSSLTSVNGSAFEYCSAITSLNVDAGNTHYTALDNVLYSADGKQLIYYATGLTDTSFTIPSGVTSIGTNSFSLCNLNSVTIPSSVTSISGDAFTYCYSLTSITVDPANTYYAVSNNVLYTADGKELICYPLGLGGTTFTIPDGVTSIGNNAFQGASIQSVDFPSSLISIGNGAFIYGNLTLIILPSALATIGNAAFQNNSLNSVSISSSVTSIGEAAFANNSSLTSISGPNNAHYTSLNNVLYSADGKQLLQYAVGLANTSFTIPDGVINIGNYAFASNYNISSIVVPSSVTSIGDYAFSFCFNLSSLNLPSSVKSIGNYVFISNYALLALTIPSSITNIGNNAFYSNVLKSITIPSSVTNIGHSAFLANDGNSSVVNFLAQSGQNLPQMIGAFGGYSIPTCKALYNSGVYEYGSTTPANSTTFSNVGFASSSDVSIDSGGVIYTYYTDYPIPGNNYAEVTGNDGSVFDVTIQSSITVGPTVYPVVDVSDNAFLNFSAMTAVSIPSSVTYLGMASFQNTGLTSVNIPTSVSALGPTNFSGGVFAFCALLTSVILSSSLTETGNATFAYCQQLTSVTIPSSVTHIGYSSFAQCGALTSIIIPATVTIIDSYSFQGSINLASVTFSAISGKNLPDMSNTSFETGVGTARYYTGVYLSDGVTLATNDYFLSIGFAGASPIEPPPPITCFKEDSKILTDKGYIPIQDLRKGDLIKTLKHDYLPIVMIGKKDIYHPASEERIKDQLYKCSQEKYPEVFEDLIITGCHSILVDGFTTEEQFNKIVEVHEGKVYGTDNKFRLPACVDERAFVYDHAGNYTIYHLALENDDYCGNYGIYANGLLVETCSKRYLKELADMTLIE